MRACSCSGRRADHWARTTRSRPGASPRHWRAGCRRSSPPSSPDGGPVGHRDVIRGEDRERDEGGQGGAEALHDCARSAVRSGRLVRCQPRQAEHRYARCSRRFDPVRSIPARANSAPMRSRYRHFPDGQEGGRRFTARLGSAGRGSGRHKAPRSICKLPASWPRLVRCRPGSTGVRCARRGGPRHHGGSLSRGTGAPRGGGRTG